MKDPEEIYQELARHLKNDEEGLELASRLWEATAPKLTLDDLLDEDPGAWEPQDEGDGHLY